MFCEDNRRYNLEVLGWMATYTVLLLASIYVLRAHPALWPPLRVALALVPVVPLFGVLNVAMRKFREADELQKKITSEGIMFGFGVAAIVTLSYGFLDVNDVVPPLSFVWVWPILGFGWGVGVVIARRRYR